MATIVLVHGGWIGGWAWQHHRQRLQAAGHEVFTPTLTGLGERVHLAQPGVDLALHVQDVVNLLEAEDLRDVVLAGHSYGGMVITGVAEQAPKRLAHLVYLDAFAPRDGESLLDLLQPQARWMTEDSLRRSPDGWRVRWPGSSNADPWPLLTPRYSPQPWLTFSQPLAVTNPAAERLPRTYVRCTLNKASGEFDAMALNASWERAKAAGWRIHEFGGSHQDLLTERGASVLLELFPPDR
ncbi:MAG TPA: alpha/beta hydrolase [Chloroflexota bacterium]|jgi:pimeloyl-ACP methyl ester carboxylesterase|nr:alpha/beta hydrolase [Chloroflexota bacterium]